MRSLSVVIPVLGDADALAVLLRDLGAQSPPPLEILVVDGGDDPRCREACRAAGAVHLPARPGRGHQLRLGAARARGAALWFLHADAGLPPGATGLIVAALAGGAAGGCFRFRFAGEPAFHKRALAALVNLRARFSIPYGDQALFATREAYASAGGFADQPLFEEVQLVKGLRRVGRFVTLPAAIAVSPRRWERDGWWRRTIDNRLLALGYAVGVPPETLARRYRASIATARRRDGEAAR